LLLKAVRISDTASSVKKQFFDGEQLLPFALASRAASASETPETGDPLRRLKPAQQEKAVRVADPYNPKDFFDTIKPFRIYDGFIFLRKPALH
jgi:hypothetical protein